MMSTPWQTVSPLEQFLLEPYTPHKPEIITVIFTLPPTTPSDVHTTIIPGLLTHPRFAAIPICSRKGLFSFTTSDITPRDHLTTTRIPDTDRDFHFQSKLESIVSSPLDLTRPLWQIYLFPNYAPIPKSTSTVVLRVHHALADGVGLVKFFISRAVGPQRSLHVLRPPRRVAVNGANAVRTNAISRFLRASLDWGYDFKCIFIKPVLPAQRSPITTPPLQEGNTIALQHAPFNVAALKAATKALGVTINDLLFASLAGAVRTYIEEEGGAPSTLRRMRVAMPFASHTWDEFVPSDVSNKLVMLPVSIPVHVRDRRERLEVCADTMRRLKRGSQPQMVMFAMKGLVQLPGKLRRALWHHLGSSASLLFSNVAGPREKLDIGGGIVDGVFFLPPPNVHVAFDVAVLTYGGEVFLSAGGDVQRMKKPKRVLQLFVDEVEEFLQTGQAEASRRGQALEGSKDD